MVRFKDKVAQCRGRVRIGLLDRRTAAYYVDTVPTYLLVKAARRRAIAPPKAVMFTADVF